MERKKNLTVKRIYVNAHNPMHRVTRLDLLKLASLQVMKKHWKHRAQCSQKNNWIQEERHPAVFQITPGWPFVTGARLKEGTTLVWFLPGNSALINSWNYLGSLCVSYVGLKMPCGKQQRCCCCCTGHPYQTRRVPYHNMPAPGLNMEQLLKGLHSPENG